ncbi:hypothetical protein N4T77_16945 [Clostridium sp. CX1]|uniref:hypothetical protein n=1 Tax=Clostridium sp. CX1 TaxID=2978346 RepID=UPI0021C1B6B0|nr:hypothetical protein [Clostridium sp. CX1]MCT8978277.1 hypothetical protein [Clostridium sp. CX1]
MNKAFETLIESINAQIFILLKNGYKIHDAENLEFFISEIRYDNQDNTIKFDLLEDKNKRED